MLMNHLKVLRKEPKEIDQSIDQEFLVFSKQINLLTKRLNVSLTILASIITEIEAVKFF
ncbi:hypothetical protein [Enterococcus sp. AZ072]|uniref:hypothetical protein n=2 Tax=Enterococcus TaxID=1350 RepID=UPI003D26876F